MPKFIPYNRDQNAMVVINFRDQIQPGTFEHAIYYLINHKLDLSIFHPRYNNDDNGRPAYDPAILLSVILFAYSKGITSSREIQWCCENNIIFKALSCDSVPHFTTIAHFISSQPEAIQALFEQMLLVCHQQGLLGNELFAIDGCKMSSNAAKEWSGTFAELKEKRRKIKRLIKHQLEEHQRLDKQEASEQERQRRAEQAIDTLEKAHAKIDRFLKTQSPRKGQGTKSPCPNEPSSPPTPALPTRPTTSTCTKRRSMPTFPTTAFEAAIPSSPSKSKNTASATRTPKSANVRT